MLAKGRNIPAIDMTSGEFTNVTAASATFTAASLTSIPLADEACDAVYSSHNVEHLAAHEVPAALREFWRVLKPGGFALVLVPDLQHVAESLAAGIGLEDMLYESPSGPICPIDVLFGYRQYIDAGNEFYRHKTGFTASTLFDKLDAAGFSDVTVRRDGNWELVARAVK